MRTLSKQMAILPLAIFMGSAVAEDRTYNFNIPAQPLSAAVEAVSKQTGLQPFYADGALAGKQSPALKGNYSKREAVAKLLADSGLDYTFTGDNTLAVKAKANQPVTTLKPVKVTADNIRDIKDPYNEDYVLPNATSGTKTDTPIMETPLNVQVISKQVLKDQQVTRLDQALKNVSGVTTGISYDDNGINGGTNQAITLRGFSSNIFMRNGFRLQNGSPTREMANVESVEVLKGSAAMLYGQVEPGGMVNVNTKQPLATSYYSMQQQFGSFSNYRTTIDATGPLTKDDTLLYRMNLSYENSGSFRQFVNNEKVYVAPVVKWNISPKTQATFELEYSHQNLGMDIPFLPTYNGQYIQIPRNTNYGEPATGKQNGFFGGFNWSHQFNDDWSFKQTVAVNDSPTKRQLLGLFTPQYSPTSDTIDRTLYQSNTKEGTYSTNIDLTGHFNTLGLKHTLLLGGDYYRYNYNLTTASDNFLNFSNDSYINILNPAHPGLSWNGTNYVPYFGQFIDPTTPYNYNYKQATDQYGLYMQDQIKLPYNVHVTGGLRYQYIHKNTNYQGVDSPAHLTAITQDAVTPRVGILWQPQNWLSLYSNYTENFGANNGFVFPTGNPVPATGSYQWEVGTKTEFFDGRLRATFAYFDLTKTNIVTGDLAHPGFSLVTGAVRSRGPEVDIQGTLLPGWNIIATYSNTDIIVTKGNGSDYPAIGSRYYGVPRNTGSFWNTYEFQQTSLKGVKLGGGVTIRDGQGVYTGGYNTGPLPLSTIPGYATVDLLASYSVKVGKSKVTAQLNVNNLLDKYYYNSAFFGAPPIAQGYDGAYVNFGAPRTFMGSIRVEY